MSISTKPEEHPVAPAARVSAAAFKVRESLAGSRLCKHADYQRVYAEGRKHRSASMSWFLAPQTEVSSPRVGLTVGKVLGKSHERNRIKRRLREVLRRHVGRLPAGCDLILHPHRSVLTLEFTKLDAEIVRILQQANAEQARANPTHSPRSGKAEPVR
jgi:ribonuclease P protein component